MTFLLDSNACITFLRGRNQLLASRLLAQQTGDVVVCSIVVGELLHGAEGSANPLRERVRVVGFLRSFKSLPFDDPAASEYGRIRFDLERRGLRIGDNDMLIAAIAVSNNLKLVTHNTAEFSRIPNLAIVDWEVP